MRTSRYVNQLLLVFLLKDFISFENITAIPAKAIKVRNTDAREFSEASNRRPTIGYALASERNMLKAKLQPMKRPTRVWKTVCNLVLMRHELSTRE